MKRFAMTMILTCTFSASALAGDIPSGGIAPPQTSSTTTAGNIPTMAGDIPTSGSAEQLSSNALSALLTVLGLLSV